MFLLEDHMSLYIVISMSWQVAGETVHIRKQEELIKPKKILTKIDMESEWQELEKEGHPSNIVTLTTHVWESFCCSQALPVMCIYTPSISFSHCRCVRNIGCSCRMNSVLYHRKSVMYSMINVFI